MAVVLSWERRAACPSIPGPRTELLYQDLACDSMNGQVAAAVGNEIVKHGRVYSNIDSGEATTVVSEDKVMESNNLSSAQKWGERNQGQRKRKHMQWVVPIASRSFTVKTAASGVAGQESDSGRLRDWEANMDRRG